MLESLMFWTILSYVILFIAFVLIIYVVYNISKDVKRYLKNRKEKKNLKK